MSDNDVVEGPVVDGEGGIYLEVGGEKFECRRVSTSYQMMKFAKAQQTANVVVPKNMPAGPKRTELEEKRNAAGMQMMAVMLETVMILLKPRERERFDEFMAEKSMSDEGIKPSELEDAIGEVIAAVGGESDKGKAEQATASLSSESSQTTNEPTQVVSLGMATQQAALPAQTSSTQ